MINDILFAAWFLLPAAIANIAPVLVAKVPGLAAWDAPIDGGRMFRGHDLLGPHKTWRGFVAGIILATLTLCVQQLLSHDSGWVASFSPVEYATLPTLILGPLFAIGALGGDAVESFFKRQSGIKSGGSWVPFDQIDYIIGAIIATLPVFVASAAQYAWMLGIWFVMHLLGSYVGYLLRLKKDPI